MAIFSDNIDRAPSGFETSGSLITMRGDINLSGDLGAINLDLDFGGGWESIDNGDTGDSDNYYINLNGEIPWAETGYVTGTAIASHETVEPEVTDINQARVRTRRSTLKVEVGKRATSAFDWHTALSSRTEKRFDRDYEETEGILGYNLNLDKRNTIAVDAGFNRGSEDFDGDSWTGSSVSIDIRKRSDRTSSRSYQLAWEGQDLEQAGGTGEWSDKVSVLISYQMEMPSGWSISTDLGISGIKPPAEDRRWDPHAKLDLSSALKRKVQFTSTISTSSTIQDPVENEVAWTLNSQARTGLVWKISKAYTVEPVVQFHIAERFGNGTADRTDETLVLTLGTRWLPSRNWSVGMSARTEDRNSSVDSFDLTENKLTLNFSGSFL